MEPPAQSSRVGVGYLAIRWAWLTATAAACVGIAWGQVWPLLPLGVVAVAVQLYALRAVLGRRPS